jgi:hypothetical protein
VKLTAIYEEKVKAKKTAPKRRGRPTAKKRFTDLLFPHTVKYKSKKGKQLKKEKQLQKGKKDRQVSDQKGRQISAEDVREKAEKRFEY